MNYRSVKVQRIPCSLIVAAILQCVFFCGGCAPKPPTHGTAYILEIETNGVAQIDNALLTQLQKTVSRRLEKAGVRAAFVEQLPGARLQIKVPTLPADDAAM